MASKKNYEDYVNTEVLEDIKKWKIAGQIDDWIYKKKGIGRSKGIEWKKNYKDFANAFKKGREELIIDLEQTMYTRAAGFYAEDEEITYNGEGEVIKRVTKKKYIWSDQCLQMALRGLAAEKWNALEKERLEIMRRTAEGNAGDKLPEFFNKIDEQLEDVDD